MTIRPPQLCGSLPAGTPALPGPRVPVACPGGQPEGGLSPNRCLRAGFYPVRLSCLSPHLPQGLVPLPGGHTGSTRPPRLHAGFPWLCSLAGTVGLLEIPGAGSNPPLLSASWGCIALTIPAPGEGMERAGSWGGSRWPLRLTLARLHAGKGEEIACVQMVSVKRRRFLLSPPLSPVTSSVISV